MFTPHLAESRDSVTNEVLSNVLAKEFILPVSDANLIEMDENFRMIVKDRDAPTSTEYAGIDFLFVRADGNPIFF